MVSTLGLDIAALNRDLDRPAPATGPIVVIDDRGGLHRYRCDRSLEPDDRLGDLLIFHDRLWRRLPPPPEIRRAVAGGSEAEVWLRTHASELETAMRAVLALHAAAVACGDTATATAAVRCYDALYTRRAAYGIRAAAAVHVRAFLRRLRRRVRHAWRTWVRAVTWASLGLAGAAAAGAAKVQRTVKRE